MKLEAGKEYVTGHGVKAVVLTVDAVDDHGSNFASVHIKRPNSGDIVGHYRLDGTRGLGCKPFTPKEQEK